jgi:FKBP-type peptidyl-prolyl cis-trans isomerase SlpA
MKEVRKNDSITVHYTCASDGGMLYSSRESRKPMQFTVGKGKLLRSIENGVIGMKLNETKVIKIPHHKAYGDVQKELVQEVDKSLFPGNIEIRVGHEFTSTHKDGSEINFRVIEIKENSVVVDANHPLAGKNLEFEIEIIEIN